MVTQRTRRNPRDWFLGKITAKSSPSNLARSSTEKRACVRTQPRASSSGECTLLCVNHIFHLMDDCVVDCFVRSNSHTNESMTIIIDQADACFICLYLLLRHFSKRNRIVTDASALVLAFPHCRINELSIEDNPFFVCFFYCEEKFLQVYVMLTCTRRLLLCTEADVAYWAAHSWIVFCTRYLLIVEFFLLYQQTSHFSCSIRCAWVPDYGDPAKTGLEWTGVGNEYSLEYLLFSS